MRTCPHFHFSFHQMCPNTQCSLWIKPENAEDSCCYDLTETEKTLAQAMDNKLLAKIAESENAAELLTTSNQLLYITMILHVVSEEHDGEGDDACSCGKLSCTGVACREEVKLIDWVRNLFPNANLKHNSYAYIIRQLLIGYLEQNKLPPLLKRIAQQLT